MSKLILLLSFISCCNFFLFTISSPFSLHSQNLMFGTKLKLKTKKYFTKLKEHSPIICDVVSTTTKSFVRTTAFRIPINLVQTAVEQPPRLSDEEDCVEWLTEGVERGIRDGKCAAVKDGTRVLLRNLRKKEDVFNHLVSVAVCDCFATYRHGPLAMSKQIIASLGSMLINREVRTVLFHTLVTPLPPPSPSLVSQTTSPNRIIDSGIDDCESGSGGDGNYTPKIHSDNNRHHNRYSNKNKHHNNQYNPSREIISDDTITIDDDWIDSTNNNNNNNNNNYVAAYHQSSESEEHQVRQRVASTATTTTAASYNRTVECVKNGTRLEERVEFKQQTVLN